MDWKDAFKAHTLRTNFLLGLTRPQLEYLCAVADDVVWDRFSMGCQSAPYNTFAVSKALEKRGLIERKTKKDPWNGKKVCDIKAFDQLTAAGVLVCELLKITGIFIEADNAIERKASRKVRGIR